MAIELWDPEGEWIPAMAGAVEGKVYRGTADLRRYFDDFFESFSEVRVDDLKFQRPRQSRARALLAQRAWAGQRRGS
jgi:hypothetical protein